MNRKLVLLFACFLMAISMAAQKRVTGRVTDTNGAPVANAAVRVAGTKVLTYTDANGNFTLSSVPNTAKDLTISYLGYEAQTVAISSNVQVTLKESENALDEAVVIGYGTGQKLGTIVGTVSRVGSEKIENKPVTTALDALQGKVAGVQILTSSGDAGEISAVTTTIRGTGSLSASNEPLFIVDGTPVASSVFYMMNQNDIESYTVLRDASATSIYGSRAANGVVYVTTKKGYHNQAAVIKVGQSLGWSQIARRVGNPMNANELLEYQMRNGIISGADYAAYKKTGVNTDWQNYFFDDNVPMYNTTFSISGGSDKTTYYTSASYLKKSGLTARSKFRRYTVRTNLDTKANDWFSMGLTLGLNYDERQSDYINEGTSTDGVYLNSGVLGGVMAPTYVNPYDADGKKLTYIPWLNGGNLLNEDLTQYYNPNSANDARINGTAYVQLTPIKGLTIRSQLGLDAADTRGITLDLPSDPRNTKENQGYASHSFSRFATWTITNTAEYKWDLKDIHKFTFLVGQEGIKSVQSAFSGYSNGQGDDRLMELDHGLAEDNLTVSSTDRIQYEYLSFFGRVDYGFTDKYHANFTIRNDRSSRFGKNNRSATFAAGGLMWDMKLEDWLKPVWWLDDLKLKVSYGSTGNSGIGNYNSLGIVSRGKFNNMDAWYLSYPGNADLGWETQVQGTFTVSTRIFNRANLEFSLYNKKTKDMLMNVPVPYTTGFSSQLLNIGAMTNRGFEFTFDVDAVKNWNGLNVNVYGNIAYNNNKIDELFYGMKEWIIQDAGIAYFVGKSVNYYMPIRAGIDPADGKIMWYVPDENGKNSGETTKEFDETALKMDTGKKMTAPWTGGFGLNATWKGLTLSADFAFVLDKWMQDNIQYFSKNSNFSQSGYNQDKCMLREWQQPGDITDVPKFGETNQFDSSLLQNASFCRLKNLSLSYELPGKWMDATGFIRNVRLMATARNLFTITNWEGSDPETDTNVARETFPNTREFSLGIELTF